MIASPCFPKPSVTILLFLFAAVIVSRVEATAREVRDSLLIFSASSLAALLALAFASNSCNLVGVIVSLDESNLA